MEFRRIASFIYKRNLKWRKAVALAKTDKLYKDAMETVAQVRGTLAFAVAMKRGGCTGMSVDLMLCDHLHISRCSRACLHHQ